MILGFGREVVVALLEFDRLTAYDYSKGCEVKSVTSTHTDNSGKLNIH